MKQTTLRGGPATPMTVANALGRRCIAPALLLAVCVAAGAAPGAPKAAASGECRPGEASFFRDEALAIKVATRLQFNKTLLREKVNVKVSAGVATLWGGLSTTEHIEIAVRLASEVEGIGCVNNFLKVGPPEGPDRAAPPPG
jgi:BON domain